MVEKKTVKEKVCGHGSCAHCGGAVYGLGLIGALFYYLSTATGFGPVVMGIIKAILWPAFLVFNVLKFIGA
jgi:hypothetical protein